MTFDLFLRLWPKVEWPIVMSRGIRSVLCAPAVRPSWQVSTSPPGMTALTASSALETCTPRSVRPAANPSQARMHHCVYITVLICEHTCSATFIHYIHWISVWYGRLLGPQRVDTENLWQRKVLNALKTWNSEKHELFCHVIFLIYFLTTLL